MALAGDLVSAGTTLVIPELIYTSTLQIAFQYALSNCSTQTLCNNKNDLLAVAELLRQIRTCSLRFNSLE